MDTGYEDVALVFHSSYGWEIIAKRFGKILHCYLLDGRETIETRAFKLDEISFTKAYLEFLNMSIDWHYESEDRRSDYNSKPKKSLSF